MLRGPRPADAGRAREDVPAPEAAQAAVPQDVRDAVRDARLFRARLADAFDDAVARLVRELASEVLMRELRLAPCDMEALVRRVRERTPVVEVRVAPSDVAHVTGVRAIADPSLQPGDAVFALRSGALDVRLGVRLNAVLEQFA
jgi:flagellar biosynthesis/type III secretory pathway protein FliH